MRVSTSALCLTVFAASVAFASPPEPEIEPLEAPSSAKPCGGGACPAGASADGCPPGVSKGDCGDKAAAEGCPKGGWKRFMPKLGIAAAADVGAELGGGMGADGAFDRDTSGFAFDWLELGLIGRWGGKLVLDAALLATASDVHLDHAAIGVDNLPWKLEIRGGMLRSRVGYESARSPWAWAFPDQAVALGRVFGPLGHVYTGADLAFDIPAPWTLRPYFSAGMATGPGMRSFYGAANVSVDALRDLAWQLGVENWIAAGPLDLSFEFGAILGPNDSGRANYSDVLAFGAALVYPRSLSGPNARPDGVGVRVETEWYVRRRQVPGRNLADSSGFLSVEVDFAGAWEAGLRFDYAQALEASALDAAPVDVVVRATLLLGYEPAEWVSLDLVSAIEKGGAHDEIGYSVQLAVRAGLIPEVSR